MRQYDEILKAGPLGPLFWRAVLIDEAARAACEDLALYVLENTARGVTWERMRAPCCRNTFFRARSRFFGELDRRLKEVTPFEAAGSMGGELSQGADVQ